VDMIVEPTIGLGGFASTAPTDAVAKEWLAWEINPQYVACANSVLRERGIAGSVEQRDVFDLDQAAISPLVDGKTVLAIGNPPWVTNAAQSSSAITNLPLKRNRFGLSGLDAMTGRANFDIAEAVLLALVDALSMAKEIRLAFLVKRSVALKMARDLLGRPGVTEARYSSIDAKRWFGASVEAGLFEICVQPAGRVVTSTIELRDGLNSDTAVVAGYHRGVFAEDLGIYAEATAVEALPDQGLKWRQGIKHDLARILELKGSVDGQVNGLGEHVEVEPDVLCPLYKSSDLANGRAASRYFPLYQRDLSGPTVDLSTRWPKLDAYLRAHSDLFLGRRSRIYQGKPNFMLFGVGPYTSAPYKVAISGFYGTPIFRVLGPSSLGAPPLVDDTCYLLPFESLEEALEMAEYLNGVDVQRFLLSIADRTAKRPYTKQVLGRIRDPGATAELPRRANVENQRLQQALAGER
jgi:hypothetical protein